MKRLESLKGVITLNRNQQKSIFGGDPPLESGDGGGGGGPCSLNRECTTIIDCSGSCDRCEWHPNGHYKICRP
jgi:hypothetical protein